MLFFFVRQFKCLCLWYSFWPQEAELHHGPDPSVHTNRLSDITVMIFFLACQTWRWKNNIYPQKKQKKRSVAHMKK